MNQKLCRKCKLSKPETRFDPERRVCKDCRNKQRSSGRGPRGPRPGISRTGEVIKAGVADGRTCCDCKKWKPAVEFWVFTPTGNLFAYCKRCDKAKKQKSHKIRYADTEYRENYLAKSRAAKGRRKKEVIAGYGGKCACCGESRWEFLTLDHVNGDGAEHRRSTGLRTGNSTWAYARREGFPGIFRLLCWNCNSARGAFGYCPHEMPE